MVQWAHGYGLAPEDLRMIARTFGTAFPAATLWGPTEADYLLVGSLAPQMLDLAAIGARVASAPAVRRDLEGIGRGAPVTLLADFLLGEEDLSRYAATGGLNTDDRLPLEFSAPRALYLDTGEANWRLVHQFRQASLPEVTASSRPALDHADVWIHAPSVPLVGFIENSLLDPRAGRQEGAPEAGRRRK